MGASPSQRKLAAILSADAVGFSRLMGADEDGTLDTLNAHRGAFDASIGRHGGRVVGSAGDSILAAFDSVLAALATAVEVQSQLARDNAALTPERRLDFRIGINLGEVIVEGETIFGDGVNIAARLQEIAAPGGICVSASVYEQVRKKVDLGFRPLGPQRMKNIADPVPVYAVEATAAAPRPGGLRRFRGLQRSHALWAAGIAAAAAAGAVGWWLTAATPESPPPMAEVPVSAAAARPVVAVLPFANLSGNPSEDYFSDGITEDVIAALGRFSDLAVIARNSAFAYRSQDLPAGEIGRRLHVRYVVEGSVRRAGERVRVAIQLIEADSGLLRWAEHYDAEMKDIFAVQDEITRGIVGALAAHLTRIETARSVVKAPASLAAYDYVLRGRQALARDGREANFAARELFRKAIDTDDTYAPAYVGLGHAYVNAVLFGWVEDPVDALTRAERLGQRAIALDENDAWAHALLGRVYQNRREPEAALRELDRAIALNPNDAEILADRGETLVWSSKPREGVRSLETALRYDPNMSAKQLVDLGFGYYLLGEYDDALRVFERSARLRPENAANYIGLAATYGQLGRHEDAERAAASVRRLNPFLEPALFGAILPDPRHRTALLEGLRKAGLK